MKWRTIVFVCLMAGFSEVVLGLEIKLRMVGQPYRVVNNTPVFPMLHSIQLSAQFGAGDEDAVDIEDPETTPRLYLQMKRYPDVSTVGFRVNPIYIDRAGEVTAPISKIVHLDVSQSVSKELEILSYCMDFCFQPGKYGVAVSYGDKFVSEYVDFFIEFSQESVPLLLRLATDEGESKSLRLQALEYLGKVPGFPVVRVGVKREEETERLQRIEENRQANVWFSREWEKYKESDQVKQVFRAARVK